MTTPLADVFAGSSPATSVSQALNLNQPTAAVPNNSSKSDRFWSSEKLPATSDVQEVLEMNFSTASLTNRISFQAARFPQNIRIEYTNDSSNNWKPAVDAVTGNPIVVQILKSFPLVLPSANAVSGHSHPQHDYDGHWQNVSLIIVPDDMQKIRLVIQRNSSGQVPIDSTGSPVPYSVALQNIYIGYEISSESDVPRSVLEDGSQSSEHTFANSSDIFGSNLGFSKKTNFANNLLFNSDVSAPLIWKSEPQPFPRAVVNFYADLRDVSGKAQVIDRIFIDPLYDGSHITLYYSNDSVGTTFLSSTKALNGGQAAFNNASIQNNAISLGSYGTTSFLQVNNSYTSFDPSQAWWTGLEYIPSIDPHTDSNDHVIFSCSAFQIGYNQDNFFFRLNPNDIITLSVGGIDQTKPVQLVAGYNNGNMHFSVSNGGITVAGDLVASVKVSSSLPPLLFIGSDPTGTMLFNQSIDAFILKQEAIVSDDFLTQPLNYSLVPRFDSASNPGRSNALLRFDPSQTSATAATGLIGGPAFNYETMTWTPIPREYEMHRGNMQLPATKAKFWNLEITNLRAEVSEKFIPVQRQIKTFPPEVMSGFDDSNADRTSSDDLATNVESSLSNSMSFTDIPLYVGTGVNDSGFSNTEVYVATDTATTERLQLLGTQWNYEQWRADRSAPRFNKTSQHNYTVEPITQTSNVSYFTGLRQIQFSRTVNTAPQDHSFIEETFVDGNGVNSGNWYVKNEGGLYSGTNLGSSYARTTSIVIPTQRAIRGVQFAVQQTDAKPINITGEFGDDSYDPSGVTAWSSTGDGKILGLTQTEAGGDTALLVSRQSNVGFWADISANYVTWGALAMGRGYQSGTQNITFANSSSIMSLQNQGIQQSSIQIISTDGSISYSSGTDYTVSSSDGSQPDTITNIQIVGAGSIPTGTPVLVFYNFADAAHPTNIQYKDLSSGTINPTYTGGIQSQPVNMPIGGRIYAAARVTATKTLTQPLWIQIFDADTGGLIAEEQSNVGKNEVKEWYTGIDLKTFGGRIGQTWGDLVGKKIWPSWSDNFTRPNASTLGNFVSGQPWTVPFGYSPLTIAGNVAVAGITSREEVNTGTPWGTLSVTLGNAITTGTHSAAQPVIDLGGMLLMNDATVQNTTYSATLFTMASALTAGHKYDFQFMPTSVVPGGQQVAGADPVARPYSVVIFDNGTWVKTYSGTESFSATRALLGAPTQTFSAFSWTPGTAQVNLTNQRLTMPVPSLSALVDSNSSDNTVFWDQDSTHHWIFTGAYTYTSNNQGAVALASNPPSLGTGSMSVAGTMAVTDVRDQFGSMDFSVTQVASTTATSLQAIAYLNYNPATNKIITLQADGTIYDQINATTLKSTMFTNAAAGPISVRYVSAQTLSSGFKTTWSVTGSQAMIFLQSNVVVGVYSGTGIWDTTVRGIGGAVGSGANPYTIIEGFSWNPDGALLAVNTSSVTWAMVNYASTRTYGLMSNTTLPSTQNIMVRLVQKSPSLDYWFAESIALFWDPVIWQFSCDGGISFWNAGEIKNDPHGVLQFPLNLSNYNKLQWRVTSYSGDVSVNNLTIRPWYAGMPQGIPPRPTQLPTGPNLVPSDHYGPIEKDPKFMVWAKPVPRSWWFNFKKTNLTS